MAGKTENVVRLVQPGGAVELTARRISNLKPRSRVWDQRDAKINGLMVRVHPTGRKTYYLMRRIGSGRVAKQRRIKLGDVTDISLAEARNRALAMVADMIVGDDPAEAKIGDIRLEDLIDLYDKRLEARQVVKRSDVISCLQSYLKPYLRQPSADLTRQKVVAIINRTEEAGRRGAAEYLRKCTTGLLNWGVDAGHLQASVMAGYRRERATRAERHARERLTITTQEQLAVVWQAAESASGAIFRDLFRFLLLTGQRRTETAAVRWADLDGDVWSIPAEITKTGKAHRVPLGPLSQQIIGAQELRAGTDLVFPGRGYKQISGWTQQLRPIREAAGMPTLSPHALRRSFRTGLSELGVSTSVAEIMIAHQREDLIGRYDHAELWTARIEAQRLWEEYLAGIGT